MKSVIDQFYRAFIEANKTNYFGKWKFFFNIIYIEELSTGGVVTLKLQCSGPCFAPFRLNTERYFVFLRIQSECGKIWTRITLNTDTFSRSERLLRKWNPSVRLNLFIKIFLRQIKKKCLPSSHFCKSFGKFDS